MSKLIAAGWVMLVAAGMAFAPLVSAETPRIMNYEGGLTQRVSAALTETPNAQSPEPAPTVVRLQGLSVSAIPPEDIARISLTGISPYAARTDHMHRGVRSIHVKDGDPLYEDVIIDAGSNISLQQVGNTLIVSAAGGGDITGVTAGNGLIGGGTAENVLLSVATGPGLIATGEELRVDVGTGANQIVQLNGQGKLPSVDASLLKELDASALTYGTIPGERLSADVSRLGEAIESDEIADGTLKAKDTSDQFLRAGVGVILEKSEDSWLIEAVGAGGDITSVEAGEGLRGGASSGSVKLSVEAGEGLIVSKDGLRVDAGERPGQIVQLDEEGALPAVNASRLSQLNADALSKGTIPDARLASEVSRLGSSIGSSELEEGLIQEKHFSESSVGAEALSAQAIVPGDIEVEDLPLHAVRHLPDGSDGLPTAAAVAVGESNEEGMSRDFSRSDHVHEGVHSLKIAGNPPVLGDVVLTAGTGIALEQEGRIITITAKGLGAPGARLSETSTEPLSIEPGRDTELLALRLTKSQTTSVILVLATVQLAHKGGAAEKTIDLQLWRDAQPIGMAYQVSLGRSGKAVAEIPVTLQGWDTSGKGTHTFTLSARSSASGAEARQRQLSVIELF